MKQGLNIRLISTISIAFIMGLVFYLSFASLSVFSANTVSGQEKKIAEVIRKAAVACYALEGAYPADIEYLEAHYGIILDWDTYVYYYDCLGENMIPDVIVKSLLISDEEAMEDWE